MSFQTVSTRKKIIFLGTPDVSAQVLEFIYQKLAHLIEIVAVVSQPMSRSKRNGDLTPSPVHQLAQSLGIPVLTPMSIKDQNFIDIIKQLEPDLCLTASYGKFLSKSFLDIPKYGTLNIHPSLLPLYRGASPVQRTLENGDSETGVTLLFSTLAMDAGPIFAQEKVQIDDHIKASQLLKLLFLKGVELFSKNVYKIFTDKCPVYEQNHLNATHAKKISKEEGVLDFQQSAQICHNKVRAFDIWPKTIGHFLINEAEHQLKIITTEVVNNEMDLKPKDVFVNHKTHTLDICCGDLKILRVIEIQEQNKRVMTSKEYINGLHGRKIISI